VRSPPTLGDHLDQCSAQTRAVKHRSITSHHALRADADRFASNAGSVPCVSYSTDGPTCQCFRAVRSILKHSSCVKLAAKRQHLSVLASGTLLRHTFRHSRALCIFATAGVTLLPSPREERSSVMRGMALPVCDRFSAGAEQGMDAQRWDSSRLCSTSGGSSSSSSCGAKWQRHLQLRARHGASSPQPGQQRNAWPERTRCYWQRSRRAASRSAQPSQPQCQVWDRVMRDSVASPCTGSQQELSKCG